MTFGVIVFVIGAAYLLKNLGLFSGPVWEILWPLILIVLGLWMMGGKRSWCGHCGEWKKEKEENKGNT